MTSADRPSVDELDRLSTDDLRQRAFELAEKRRDVHFFWDLVRHLPPTEDIASDDASSGGLTLAIADLAELVRGMLGHDLGENEPLIRARFIDYVHNHG